MRHIQMNPHLEAGKATAVLRRGLKKSQSLSGDYKQDLGDDNKE
jgi:hypothetical protein